MNFKKLLICFVSLAATSTAAYLIACGWFIDPDMGYTSFFRNDIPEKNNYYYSYFNFYDPSENIQSDKEQNIREWKKHIGGTVTEEDIENLVYGIPFTELQEISRKATQRQWTKISGEWARNGMMRRIIQRRDLNTLNYLLYAKACEQQAGKQTESWDYTPPFDTRIQDSLLAKGLELYKGVQPEFTKLRYAYQIVRMAYYCGEKDLCVKYYEEMIVPAEKSKAMAKLWAMSFYAGALESQTESAYYFSKVFDRCPRYSDAAMMSYRWLVSHIDTAWVTALCQDNYEKAVVHAITGFTCFYPTLEPLKHVHALCPAIPYIETLLIREINKIEDGLTGSYFFENDSLNANIAIRHARQLKDLAIRYGGMKEVQHPALWYTAASYLAFLLGEYEQASLLADIAEQEHPDPKVTEQLLVVRLLIETGSGPLDDGTEEHILPALQWLIGSMQDTAITTASHHFIDRAIAHYFVEKLPKMYLANDQPVKAALCTGIAQQYSNFATNNFFDLDAFDILDDNASISQLEEMMQQLANPGKLNPYETFLYSHNSRFKNNVILELIGTKQMRALRFEDAIACFEQLSDASGVFHLEYDPFVEPSITGSRNLSSEDSSMFHSKLSFAHEMADLQKRIQISNPLPEDLYRYANGLYQMSWFGNSWQLLRYHRSSSELRPSPQTDFADSELHHYYNVSAATGYYMQAFERSRNKEFKARCLFMASHCYQMNIPDIFIFADNHYTGGSYFHNNPYFSQLTKKYKKTTFYKDAVTRCSYLSDFVRMQGK